MSLITGLLQDPVPTIRWIALRADGAEGSGSEVDPWNGSVMNTRVLSATLAAPMSVTGGFSISVTASDHGFKTDDIVLISGVTGLNGELVNGSFKITLIDEDTFKFVVLWSGNLSEGPAPAAPFAGTIVCRLDPYGFDKVMRRLCLQSSNEPVCVRLGPGVFETKGYEDFYRPQVSWTPFQNLKIRGSGMAVTTLRLVAASYRNRHYFVIGMPRLGNAADVADGFSASEFTLDCNINNQFTSELSSGAISIRGSETRLKRLRAINWGRQGPLERFYQEGGNWVRSGTVSPELFVFAVGGSSWLNNAGKYQSRDCIVEHCIVDQPGLNSVRESTMMVVSGSDAGVGNQMAIPTPDSVFLNNTVDCEYVDNPTPIINVTGLSLTGQDLNVTITLSEPRTDLVAGSSWVRVWGVRTALTGANPTTKDKVVQMDGYNNPINGSFKVATVSPDGLQFTYVSLAAGYLPTVLPASPQVGACIGRWPAEPVKIALFENLAPVAGTTFCEMTVTTQSPHFLIPSPTRDPLAPLPAGCIASISNVNMGNPTPVGTLNLPWIVTTWISAKQFICQRDYQGAQPSSAVDVKGAYLGPVRWGATGATRIEGNVFRSCARAIYADTFGKSEMVVRYNIMIRCRSGMFQTLEQKNGLNNYSGVNRPELKFLSVRSSGSAGAERYFALFETNNALPHYLMAGQAVRIEGAEQGGLTLPFFNRSFRITSTPQSNRFEVELDKNPAGEVPDSTNRPKFDWLMVTGRCVFESNIVEMLPGLVFDATPAEHGLSSTGITLQGTFPNSDTVDFWFRSDWIDPSTGSLERRRFCRYLNLTVRDNIIRYALWPSGASMTGYPFLERGMVLQSVEKGIITGNQIETDWPSNYYSYRGSEIIQKTWKYGEPSVSLYLNNPLYYFNNRVPSQGFVPGYDEDRLMFYPGIAGILQDASILSML